MEKKHLPQLDAGRGASNSGTVAGVTLVSLTKGQGCLRSVWSAPGDFLFPGIIT